MILVCSADETRHEFREGLDLILWFKWDPNTAQFLTDDLTSLGRVWTPAASKARKMAESRICKAAKIKD
jgi:hypothetical protein